MDRNKVKALIETMNRKEQSCEEAAEAMRVLLETLHSTGQAIDTVRQEMLKK